MHELSIIQGLVSILEEKAADESIIKVKSVHIEIGRLHYIVPDIMEFCFDNIPKSPKLQDAKLKFSIVPTGIKCSKCSKEALVENNDFKCPSCESRAITIVSGKGFMLKGIDFEQADERGLIEHAV